MKGIVFLHEKSQYKSHTLGASLNMDAHLVFDDGVYYPVLDGDESRELDDYLIVHAQYKDRVLRLLELAFERNSDTCCQDNDERLLYMLERVARTNHWKSLGEIEKWLMDREISFAKQKGSIIK